MAKRSRTVEEEKCSSASVGGQYDDVEMCAGYEEEMKMNVCDFERSPISLSPNSGKRFRFSANMKRVDKISKDLNLVCQNEKMVVLDGSAAENSSVFSVGNLAC
jgi:hypothetical protein|eukprot:g7859.t1